MPCRQQVPVLACELRKDCGKSLNIWLTYYFISLEMVTQQYHCDAIVMSWVFQSGKWACWASSVCTMPDETLVCSLTPPHFPDDNFKHIFLNENVLLAIKISLKFVPKGPIGNIPALVQIMAWCRLGDKPLSEPMMVSLLTHICVTRPQWVNIMHEIGYVR